MRYRDWTDEDESQGVSAEAPRRELLVELLKVLTPALGLLLFLLGLTSKYPWLTQPWVKNALVVLGILVVAWFAKPRLVVWRRKLRQRKRDRIFVATNEVRLRQFTDRFAEFISDSNNRSLIYMIRSGFSQNMTAVEQIFSGDYIRNWFASYREQLAFPVTHRMQFLARCRELGNLVQQFNSYYVLRAQKQLALAPSPLPEFNIGELESFREEFAAFLRDFEIWAKEIAEYLQSLGVAEFNAMYQFAPTPSFERVKSFRRSTPAPQ